MGSLRDARGVLGGIAFAVAILLLAVELGARATGAPWHPLFGTPAGLDYSAPPVGALVPLDPRYVDRVLGDAPGRARGDASAPAEPGAQAGAPGGVPTIVEHPPTNETYATAYEVTRVPFTGRTHTREAAREDAEPATCAPVGATLWYRFDAPAEMDLVATADADSPVALAAFAGSHTGVARELACDADARGLTKVRLRAARRTTHLFQITMQVGGSVVFTLDAEPDTSAVSVTIDGRTAAGMSEQARISGDGRFVAFRSSAGDIHPRCCQSGPQIFVRDLASGVTELVSVTDDDEVPNAPSDFPDISADGRYVVWHSSATNVVRADGDGIVDVFLRDRLLGTTELVSVAPGFNANGAFPRISADGRFVAFHGDHEDRDGPLVHKDWPNLDVYVRDRLERRTRLASAAPDGTRGNHDSRLTGMSADGRYVMFWSRASNLMSDSNTLVDHARNAAVGTYRGREYVKDMVTGALTLECRSATGEAANDRCWAGAISADGRFSAFWSTATNIVDGLPEPTGLDNHLYLYLRDRLTEAVEIVTVTNLGTPVPEIFEPDKRTPQATISADGRYVAFDSDVHLVGGDDENTPVRDVYVRDRLHDRTILVSDTGRAHPRGLHSEWPAISADGRVLVFHSLLDDLVPRDGNGTWDVFAAEMWS